MKIIPLNLKDQEKAAKVLAAAFFRYPMFTFYFPEIEHRKHNLCWYLGNVLKCTIKFGEAYTTQDVSGVMMLLPPGHTDLSLVEYIENGFFTTPYRLGFRNFIRSMRCESYVGKMHKQLMKDTPHYYLWGLAVDPDHARQGIGKALMQHLLNKADRKQLPIYLETHDEHNVAYYQRYGFQLMRVSNVPGFKLPFWCMVRQPA